MAAGLTYDSLVLQLQSYCERTDAPFISELPTFIMLAENRLATDMKQQGFQSVVKGNLTGASAMAKPAFWRETISFTFKDPTAGWLPLRLRSLEYLKNFWPLASAVAQPRFYADYNYSNFYVAPTPDKTYEFELAYYARLEPLDGTNQTNWLTLNAPQTLFYAAMLEAQLWIKNPEKTQLWQSMYSDAKGSIQQENAERVADKTEVVTRG